MKVDSWTHYEIGLFNNCMFAFDLAFIETVLPKAVKNLKKYHSIRSNISESFQMLGNLMTVYLLNHRIGEANRLLKVMKSQPLEEELVYERLLLEYFTGIVDIIFKQNEYGRQMVMNVFNIFKTLEMDTHYNMYQNFYYEILCIYKVST
ncbi:hypothetical protein IGI37_003291 [Enterococcus sp. AZ194]